MLLEFAYISQLTLSEINLETAVKYPAVIEFPMKSTRGLVSSGSFSHQNRLHSIRSRIGSGVMHPRNIFPNSKGMMIVFSFNFWYSSFCSLFHYAPIFHGISCPAGKNLLLNPDCSCTLTALPLFQGSVAPLSITGGPVKFNIRDCRTCF